MVFIYDFVIAVITAICFMLIIKSFLVPSRAGGLGFTIVTIIYFMHDGFLMLETIPVPMRCVEYLIYYCVLYVVIHYFFVGKSISNFIWTLAADFIFQTMGTIIGFLGMGIACNFKYEDFQEVSNMPLAINFILFFAAAFFGMVCGRSIIKMLLKRKNRVIQIAIHIMAAVSILASAMNSSVSLYIVFPIMCLALLVGMIYQDRVIKQKEKQEVYYSELEKRQKIRNEELEKIRHDLANHIDIIDETGNIDYAKEVLNAIDGKIRSGIPIIDCFLDEKENGCKAKGICLQEQLTDISGSTVSNFDWISLLANLLDNAMEACERVSNEKQINLELRREEVYIILDLNNSKCAEEKPIENKFITIKQKKQGHGYGTKIIKDIVKKYDGRIQYEDLGDKMNTHIVMRAW